MTELCEITTAADVLGVLHPGEHGSTFGGNPLAAAVGRAVVELLSTGDYQRWATESGAVLRAQLDALLGRGLTEVRGVGLWFGIDIDPQVGTAREVCLRLLDAGVLAKDTHTTTVRLAPPLTVTESEIDVLVTALTGALRQS